MTWQVIWVRKAEAELTRLWLHSADRERLSTAADELDRLLKRDPLAIGESREQNDRVAHVAPLGIEFRVYADDVRVEVLHVWEFR